MSVSSLAWRTILAIFLCAISGSIAAQQRDQKRVLILFSEYKERSELLESLESSLRARTKADIKFDEAYLEASYIEEKSYQDSEAETLRRRYAGLKLDLIIPVSPQAVSFTVQYHESMLPSVPVVFAGMSSNQFGEKTWQGVTGVVNHIGVGETIDLALRLQPDTTAVALISPYDPPWLAITHNELRRYAGRVKEIDFVGPPGPQLFEKVAALPPHTVVLFDLALQDSGQPPLAGFDLLDAIAERVPTYSAWPNWCLNHGCIGGVFEQKTKAIEKTADIAALVLSGEPVDKIPVANVPDLQVEVDWRALQRWHIPESALPPGTQVLFREPTLWEQGRKYFLAGIGVILVQSLLIFALFWQMARRRKAEVELGRSEQKFSKAFRRSPLAISIVRVSDNHYIDVNEAFEIQTGWKRKEVIGRSPLEIDLWVDTEQRNTFMEQLSANGNVRELEVRIRRKDGQLRTTLGAAELIHVHGEPCALSVIADITERKHAEEAMNGFSRRLIEAQETERTRIARELHDDINQRLAMLAVGLKMARQELSSSDSRATNRLEEACARVVDLERDIQALSHRLHSSKLEYLGLEAAAFSFCKEMSELQSVGIDFRCDGVPEDLSSGISLCLFRVLQEALHNAAKYSRVNEFEVSLTRVSDAIELKIHDSGAGFDPKQTRNEHGLGLTSMKERLRMVGGELSIDSMPEQGTTVIARVPLVNETGTLADADSSLSRVG